MVWGLQLFLQFLNWENFFMATLIFFGYGKMMNFPSMSVDVDGKMNVSIF
jgi:hypothetical protein